MGPRSRVNEVRIGVSIEAAGQHGVILCVSVLNGQKGHFQIN